MLNFIVDNFKEISMTGYIIIIVLLFVLIFTSPRVKCVCSTSKNARAPFQVLDNPANMDNFETTPEKQNLMNIQGCAQQGGVWKSRGDGSGDCRIYGIRPGIEYFS